MVKSKKVDIAVSEEGLTVIDTMDDKVKGQMREFLTILALNKSKHLFTPYKGIPDDAPERVKNEVATHMGECFRGGFETEEHENCVLEWYEPNNRSMVFIYQIWYPCEVELEE